MMRTVVPCRQCWRIVELSVICEDLAPDPRKPGQWRTRQPNRAGKYLTLDLDGMPHRCQPPVDLEKQRAELRRLLNPNGEV